jgi:hypothetical protein
MKTDDDTRKKNIRLLLVRMELWFAPMLIIVPMIVSFFLLQHWYLRGVSMNISAYDGELFLGLLLLVGNLIFDAPFLRSLRNLKKKL